MATTGTNIDLYLAGLFDGEGCVSMALSKKGWLGVTVRVSMCDRAPIAALHDRFGGYFSDGQAQTRNGRAVYTWAVYNAEAVAALEVFAALCMVKCVVAELALPVALDIQSNPTRGLVSAERKAARVAAAAAITAINKPVGKRRALDAASVAEYLRPKTMGGGKQVQMSDGRVFTSMNAAEVALGVSRYKIAKAAREGTQLAGAFVERV